MSDRTPKSSSASAGPRTPSPEAISSLAEAVESVEPQGITGIVETLAELQTEVLLKALEASTRRKADKMPARTLTAPNALAELKKALPDGKKQLNERDDGAVQKLADIRSQVKDGALQDFDDQLEEWLAQ